MKRIDAAHYEQDLQVPTTTGRVGSAMRKKIKADMLAKLQSSQGQQAKRKQRSDDSRDLNSMSLSSAQTPKPKKTKIRRDQAEFDEF